MRHLGQALALALQVGQRLDDRLDPLALGFGRSASVPARGGPAHRGQAPCCKLVFNQPRCRRPGGLAFRCLYCLPHRPFPFLSRGQGAVSNSHDSCLIPDP